MRWAIEKKEKKGWWWRWNCLVKHQMILLCALITLSVNKRFLSLSLSPTFSQPLLPWPPRSLFHCFPINDTQTAFLLPFWINIHLFKSFFVSSPCAFCFNFHSLRRESRKEGQKTYFYGSSVSLPLNWFMDGEDDEVNFN